MTAGSPHMAQQEAALKKSQDIKNTSVRKPQWHSFTTHSCFFLAISSRSFLTGASHCVSTQLNNLAFRFSWRPGLPVVDFARGYKLCQRISSTWCWKCICIAFGS